MKTLTIKAKSLMVKAFNNNLTLSEALFFYMLVFGAVTIGLHAFFPSIFLSNNIPFGIHPFDRYRGGSNPN